ERHILLPRKDPVVLLADAIFSLRAGEIDYRATLDLGGHSKFVAQAETREGFLTTPRRKLARVLPLALCEWRSAPARGTLQATDAGWELTPSGQGCALLSPLWIDLDARRHAKEGTWRQLTVAEDRKNVRSDEAVGYRVQLARSQWVIYRSLGPKA